MKIDQEYQIAGTWCYLYAEAYVGLSGEIVIHDLRVDGDRPTPTMRGLAEEAIIERYEGDIWAEEEEYNHRRKVI